jgi:hypothetical protein
MGCTINLREVGKTGLLEVRNRTNKHVSRCRPIDRGIAVAREAD